MWVNARNRWGEVTQRKGAAAGETARRNPPVPLVLGLIALVLVGFAEYIRASRNTAAIEANSRRLSALEQMAGDRAAPLDVSRLKERIDALENELRQMKNGPNEAAAALGSLPIPTGGYLLQRLQPPPGSGSEELLAPDQGSLDVPRATGGDLPHYERRISPDGKLILRKIQ